MQTAAHCCKAAAKLLQSSCKAPAKLLQSSKVLDKLQAARWRHQGSRIGLGEGLVLEDGGARLRIVDSLRCRIDSRSVKTFDGPQRAGCCFGLRSKPRPSPGTGFTSRANEPGGGGAGRAAWLLTTPTDRPIAETVVMLPQLAPAAGGGRRSAVSAVPQVGGLGVPLLTG